MTIIMCLENNSRKKLAFAERAMVIQHGNELESALETVFMEQFGLDLGCHNRNSVRGLHIKHDSFVFPDIHNELHRFHCLLWRHGLHRFHRLLGRFLGRHGLRCFLGLHGN